MRETDPADDSGIGFTVGTVAQALDIPVATLRSWNQRYGLGPPRHNPGEHRYYTPSDVALLGRMVDLVRAGVAPVTAAKAARAAAEPAPTFGDVGPALAAADRLDAAELLAICTTHVAHFGVVSTWNRLCRPVFADIVDRQTGDQGLIEVEHVLSWAVTTALHRAVPPIRYTVGRAPVLLACTAGENHVLPLEVLRAALTEAGIPALLLGAALPADALAAAITRQPREPVVVLWSQTERTASPVPIPPGCPAPARLLLAGPGWPVAVVFPGARRVDSLEDALGDIVRSVHTL
ncbi:MerR family transcriptional regulator [Nocardia grenadensis]|uniref:MerR family transcriptional regulator n=1 Tax=Nocardia grenadensis TaxID=931537 RepID=UPI0007A4418E|nr:MerR family transcriptional regulator [Nocardia grenadensis]